MKVQYFGDKHDFRKYLLLRQLARQDFKIGVCWMLTRDDGRADGNMRAYLDEGAASEWRHFDEKLYDLLASEVSVRTLTEKQLKSPTCEQFLSIERRGLIEGGIYFNDYLTLHPKHEIIDNSRLYFERAAEAFSSSNPDLIFFDPDNGFSETCSITSGRAAKYLYFQEAKKFYDTGKSLVVYQHSPFVPRDKFVPDITRRLSDHLGGCTVKAFETPNVLFLVAVYPGHEPRLQNVEGVVGSEWPKKKNLVWISERPTT